MSTRFENRPRVYDDIEEVMQYYLPISFDLAEKFLESIEIAKVKIANSPKGFEIKNANIVRTLLLKPFPYHLYYMFENQKIVIVAILHAQSGEEKISRI